MHYEELEPSPALRPYVRCVWSLKGSAEPESDGPSTTEPEPVVPDGCPELIFNFSDAFHARDVHGTYLEQPATMLVGQITQPFVVGPTGAVDIVAIRFESYGGALLVDNMAELTNSWRDVAGMLESLCNAELLAVPLAANSDARTTALFQLVEKLVAVRPEVHHAVRQAVLRIHESRGAVALEQLAKELGTTLRTLQRHFLRQVGVTPKTLARIVRFQNVFRAWKADPATLSRVAAECGYFDQSHLIRDFRDFAGDAPAAFLASRPEFTSFFLP